MPKINFAVHSPILYQTLMKFKLLIYLHCFLAWFCLQNTLEQGYEVNLADFREVLNKHQYLASRVTLNNDIKDLCLRIFKEYQSIMVMIAEGEPQFVQVSS